MRIPREWIQENGNLMPRVRVAIVTVVLLLLGLYLYWIGQPLICKCGYVKLWENEVFSEGNSQHIADWYTLSHFLFGMLIGFIPKVFFPKFPLRYAFFLSIAAAVTWEVVEHTEYVLSRFREATISLGYYGDSVLNGMSDGMFQALGFLTTTLVRVRTVIVIFVVLEILAATFARDSLILSTVMLVYPIDSVKAWQMDR